MLLNRCKLINALVNINNPSINKKRNWETIYKNKTSTYWNDLLWKKILEHDTIFGESINKYEFYNFCGYYCSNEKAEQIFNSINERSRSISFFEFENYLEKLDNSDYSKIIDSLEIEVVQSEVVQSEVELEVDSEVIQSEVELANKKLLPKKQLNFFEKLLNYFFNNYFSSLFSNK